jgi:hypothetical protein
MRRKDKPAIKGRAGKVFALDHGQLVGDPICCLHYLNNSLDDKPHQ